MIKRFCDNCGAEIFNSNYEAFEYDLREDELGRPTPHHMEICKDCFWLIRDFIRNKFNVLKVKE